MLLNTAYYTIEHQMSTLLYFNTCTGNREFFFAHLYDKIIYLCQLKGFSNCFWGFGWEVLPRSSFMTTVTCRGVTL